MTGYLLRRLVGAAVVLFILTVVIFAMIHSLPGDALLTKLGETGGIPESQLEELRKEMGIDRPLIVQYGDWVSGLVVGDLGTSLIQDEQSVLGQIRRALPVTVQLAVFSLAFGLVIGLSVGVLSAVYQGKWIDYAARLLAIFALSAPIFWLALVVILYSALWFQYGVTRPYVSFWDDPAGNLRVYLVPSIILGLNLGAVLMRFTRSAMLEVMRQDYIRTASAKGLRMRIIVVRHGLRNAFIPILTLLGTQTATLLSGSVIIEVIFRMPGLGRLTYDAVLSRDYTMVQGTTLIIGAIVVLTNLFVDLAYGWLDPRVRYS